MKNFIITILSILCLCSCHTVKNSVAKLDKENVVDEIIYDCADKYDVPEIGTLYDYSCKVNIVSHDGESAMYKIKINNKWYDANKSVFYKYNKGDQIRREDLKRIKK